ncbi:TPR repeat family protein, partial [Orientia tsutsugamushi str. UT76]
SLDIYINRGVALHELGQYQEAIKNFDIAIKYQPDCALAYVNKGMSLNELGHHQKAIKNYDIAIKYQPIVH